MNNARRSVSLAKPSTRSSRGSATRRAKWPLVFALIACAVFSAIGVAAVGFGFYTLAMTSSVTGTVLDSRVSVNTDSDGDTTISYRYSVSYEVAGITQSSWTRDGSGSKHEVGSDIELRVDKHDSSQVGQAGVLPVLFIVGAIFAVVGVAVAIVFVRVHRR